MPTTRINDLPREVIGAKILTRVPVTSLRHVRSTCKSWDALTKSWILGHEATSTEQFLGFMTMNSKVFTIRFQCKQKGDSVDLSMQQVDLLNQFDISQVFHTQGLLLCVTKNKSKSKQLMVWNPYLHQTRFIRPLRKFRTRDRYALGYDVDGNHKIMRFWNRSPPGGGKEVCEIYSLSSDSWRVLKVTPDWDIGYSRIGVSVKGNTYFYAGDKCDDEVGDFLVYFDFTREEFGPRLLLPFYSIYEELVTLSCVGDEKLAVLYYQEGMNYDGILEIWVTRVEPDCVSWSSFLRVDLSSFPPTGVRFDEFDGGSFFIDEREKVAVVFDLGGIPPNETNRTARDQIAYIIGEDGLFESVCLGEAPNLGVRCPKTGYLPLIHDHALVCSPSFRPSLVSLVQDKQPPLKRQRRYV
ncbi:unnamed protein product [Microthlaspi erraticum]|uniref:F-box associated beta-propeller type 1 domain-containing protein n=1 Tax=Microthlaspi erraticum TaxID=1685480 RepID=A0A6D2HL46_9BRAS|nr:unnamed protein product [Microthlaspi erraticum]